MLIGVDVNETVEFVSASDPDKEHPTVFVLRPIASSQALALAKSDDPIAIIRAGIKEIRNIVNPETKQPTTVTEITAAVIDLLPLDVFKEVVGKVVEINHLGEGETKNS